MILTEKELELVCCAIMMYKVDGKYTMRSSEIANGIFKEFVMNGRVVIDLPPTTGVKQ